MDVPGLEPQTPFVGSVCLWTGNEDVLTAREAHSGCTRRGAFALLPDCPTRGQCFLGKFGRWAVTFLAAVSMHCA